MKKLLPAKANFDITIPASKSVLQRVIIIAALIRSESIISNINLCDDVMASLELAKQIGATVKISDNKISIIGTKYLKSSNWNCDESGFCLRVATALSGLFAQDISISVNSTLKNRDTTWLKNSLSQVGINVQANLINFP